VFSIPKEVVEAFARIGKVVLILAGLGGIALVVYAVSTFGWPARHNAVVSDGIEHLNVAAWHAAGYRGGDVSIAIVSAEFTGYRRLVQRELPAYWRIDRIESGRPIENLSEAAGRGVAIGELLYDLAPEARLVFVFSPPGSAPIVAALRAAMGAPSRVVVLSCDMVGQWTEEKSAALEAQIARMRRLGDLVVLPTCVCGASYAGPPSALMIGSSAASGRAVSVELVALGTAPTVTLGVDPVDGEDGRHAFSGSDVAAAHVAAAAALVWQAYPNLTVDELEAYLIDHAEDLGVPGFDGVYGFGRVRLPAPPAL